MTAVVVLGKTEARALTEEIRTATEDLAVKLKQAHEQEAWRALGYRSWAAYIDGEFDFSRSRSYRLLSAAKQTQQLAESVGAPVRVREGTLRPVGGSIEVVAQQARANRKSGMSPQRAVDVAIAAVKQALPLKQKRAKRGIPDKASIIRGVIAAHESFNSKTADAEDEEIAVSLDGEERRLYERAVRLAGEFAERGGRILSLDVRRYREESA